MMIPYCAPAAARKHGGAGRRLKGAVRQGCGGTEAVVSKPFRRSSDMKWETPQAIDFRFGMEITMYIAKR